MKITIMPVGLLGTNCYLLASEAGGCAVIDPGAQPEKICGEIAKRGYIPRCILLTHGHHDHIGGVKKLREQYPEVPLYIGAADNELLEDGRGSRILSQKLSQAQYEFGEAELLQDGQELELDELKIRVITTPGHTKGGVCYVCGDTIFSGDTLFLGDVGRTDLYGGDYAVLKSSLQKLAGLPGDYTVYPGHGEHTTLEHERKNNRYINE